MNALVIAATNLRRMLRDRGNLFFVFVFPMVLILMIGLAFGGDSEPEIGLVTDDDAPLAVDLADRLESIPDMAIEPYGTAEDLTDATARGFVDAGVVIPDGYDSALRTGSTVDVAFVAGPSGVGQTLRAPVQAAVSDQTRLVTAARVAVSEGVAPSFGAALTQARQIEGFVPGVAVDVSRAGDPDPLEQEFAGLGRFDLGASQELLLFVFLTSLAGSSALIQTRRLGLSRRMLATPTSTASILLGEALGRFAVAMVQALYIVGGTVLIFGVNWGDPLGASAVITLFALISAAAAMLMGAVFENDAQAGSLGVFVGLALAAIGGCMAPLELFPPTMRTVAHITPHAWALEGFADLVRRGGTIVDVLPELGVLAAFAAVLLALATWRLHRAITSV